MTRTPAGDPASPTAPSSAEAVVTIPGSKSITARALFCAAAADGRSSLNHPLVADDTVAFIEGLSALGYPTARAADDEVWTVEGSGRGPQGPSARIDCRDAGTAARFLPALAAAGRGEFVVDASEQMRARPMAPLVEALRELGAAIETGPAGGLPLRIRATGLRGGALTLDARVSSQFLTALCLAAPLADRALTIRVAGLVSRPYIDLTLGVMRTFGARADRGHDGDTETIRIEPQGYRPVDFDIEPDASTASYVFAAAALTGNAVTVPGLGSGSLQGDLRFVEILAEMGADVSVGDAATTVRGPAQLRGLGVVNMRDISDTMMTLAAIAPFADSRTRIEDIANTRVKECDRLAVTAANLERLGIRVETGPDWLEIWPGAPSPGEIACHRDHRIAMSFAVAGLRVPALRLDDPDCVRKTFPGFGAAIARLRHAWGDART